MLLCRLYSLQRIRQFYGVQSRASATYTLHQAIQLTVFSRQNLISRLKNSHRQRFLIYEQNIQKPQMIAKNRKVNSRTRNGCEMQTMRTSS